MEDRIKSVLEAIAHAVVVHDESGRIVFVNSAAANTLGVSGEFLVGKAFDDPGWQITTIDGRAFDARNRIFNRVMNTGKAVRGVELVIERTNDTQIIISCCVGPLFDPAGKITHAVASFSNITCSVMKNKMLAQSEHNFSYLLKKVNFIAVIIDTQGNITYANDRFLEITGWAWEETIGKNWYSDFMTAESLWLMAQAYIRSSNRNSDSALFEGELLTKRGQKRAVSFLNVYFRDSDGQITGIANIGEDSCD